MRDDIPSCSVPPGVYFEPECQSISTTFPAASQCLTTRQIETAALWPGLNGKLFLSSESPELYNLGAVLQGQRPVCERKRSGGGPSWACGGKRARSIGRVPGPSLDGLNFQARYGCAAAIRA